ncbi:MAG: HAMP domain-containing sensor histidine kinase [Candidatus Obscuribacterales bacterium]|nr:HAMP domain-containing histidine kinase [Cyanobacteria bacterium SZAS LIN-5]RTL36558.1 MAG: HAMP domain-containing histidine kinase [Candidatus Melainabacteria bacterium]
MEETRLQNQNISILLGENPTAGMRIIRAMLKEAIGEKAEIAEVDTFAAAEKALANERFDLLLLDMDLPDSHQLRSVEAIRAVTKAPLIVLGNTKDHTLALNILRAGAEDFLCKNSISACSLSRAISFAIERNSTRMGELERLQLLELREDFMLTLTHDLKNPLLGANRLIDLIAGGNTGISIEEQRSLLYQIKDSNESLLALVQSLYEVYKYERDLQQLHLEKTDLLAVVNHYLRSVRHLMEDKRIVTHVVNNAHNAVVLADSLSISRVVQNLIENAIKFSPIDGRVEINLRTEADHVTLHVADEGPGIEPQDLQKLFLRFYQGRPGRSYDYGMGLGLYLCRQIVEAHSGKIWCAPNEETGTVFTVSLPATVQPAGPGQ